MVYGEMKVCQLYKEGWGRGGHQSEVLVMNVSTGRQIILKVDRFRRTVILNTEDKQTFNR